MGISIYEQKAAYVRQLQNILDVSEYFDSIDYNRDYLSGDEYIRIKNAVGDTYYINVTGNSERDSAGGRKVRERTQTDRVRLGPGRSLESVEALQKGGVTW